LTDALRGHWHPEHLLGRWHGRKSTRIEGYLGAIRVAAPQAEARGLERQRQRRIAQLPKFIEGKADEFATYKKSDHSGISGWSGFA
jgi:hypothetical protein